MKSASCAVVKTSGRPPAAGQSSDVRDGHQQALVHRRQLRLRAAADDRHHAISHREALGSAGWAPSATTSPASSMPGMSCGRAGRRRVQPAQLHHVAAVQPGGADAHEHLAGARHRIGVLLDHDLLLANGGGAHRCKPTAGRESRPRAGRPGTRRPSSLEEGDALDVVGLGEHVDGADLLQDPARLDELGGVGRQRGRVAGDVDDPLRRGLDDPAHDFLREPGARRIDDDHVGPTGARDQLSQRETRVAGEELYARDLVAPRGGDRVGDGLLDQLDPPQLAGPWSERERDRADPGVEVVHALPALQRRVLERPPRRAARPSRCSSGRKPRERCAGRARRGARVSSASPHTSSVSPPAVVSARLRERVHSTPDEALAQLLAQRLRERARLELAVGRDDADLQLPGAPAFAHDEVAQQRASVGPRRRPLHPPGALATCGVLGGCGGCADRRVSPDGPAAPAIPGGETLRATPAQRHLAREIAPLGGQQAVLDRHHRVAAGGAWKPHTSAVPSDPEEGICAEGVLELVAIAPRLERGHDLLQLEAVQPADPPQRVVDLRTLDSKLALVGEHLPRHARMLGARRRSARGSARGSPRRGRARSCACACTRPRARGRLESAPATNTT